MTNPDFLKLLSKAFHKRKSLFDVTNAVRLCNGIGDKLPGLVIEQYDQHYLINLFDSQLLSKRDEIASAVCELCDPQYLIVKDRTAKTVPTESDLNFCVYVEKSSSKTVVTEHGARFHVDLNDTINSGLFLDMRTNRLNVAKLSKDKKIFNGFAYTCSFGVHCRIQGASEVVNVDISKKILDRGRENYKLNNLSEGSSEFVKADAVDYLRVARKKQNKFDVIILDPPSFARNKKAYFSVRDHMQDLVELAMAVINPSGVLFSSTNYSELKFAHLEQMVRNSLGEHKIKKLSSIQQDEDFVGSGLTSESCLTGVLIELE